jgi:carboxymethylenebutenolidase
MNATFKAITAGCAVAALALVVTIGQRPAAAKAAAGADDVHAGHTMTALEHLEMLAAAGDIHAAHGLEQLKWRAQQAAPVNLSLPADDAGAAARLASSPRKGEYVTIDVGGTPMTAWVVQPQGTGRAPVVVVIQEIFGLSDWIRGVADQLAAEGFIAVAPDLLSGQGPNGGDSRSIANQQEMMKATLSLPADVLTARLGAARAYGLQLPRANGKSASIGFCFGGNQSFNVAVAEPMLNAAVVYYGNATTDAPAGGGGRGAQGPFVPSDRLKNIQAPVLGLYGGLKEDARIGATIEPTRAKMKELGKSYEVQIFDGAAHGFLRAQTGNNGANMKATQQAWPVTVAFLKKHTS